METIELSYEEQQQVIADNVWFDVLITYWNDDDEEIKEVCFSTQYPGRYDIAESIYNPSMTGSGGENMKQFGGDFDNYEITSVKKS